MLGFSVWGSRGNKDRSFTAGSVCSGGGVGLGELTQLRFNKLTANPKKINSVFMLNTLGLGFKIPSLLTG